MITSSRIGRCGLAAALALVTLAGSAKALPGTSPANTRPKMPPKPPIQGIPNGGRQGAWQPNHGAFGNAQGTAAGAAGQAGQAGQFGQGGQQAGNVNGFGGGGAFGAAGGGLAAFGQMGSGGGLAGGGLLGGLKGFSLGGGLLGPESHYANGVGLYGGRPMLDGAMPEFESSRSAKPSAHYGILMLHPAVLRATDGR